MECVLAVLLLLTVGTEEARALDEKQTCATAYTEAQSLRNDRKLLAAREKLRLCARAECSPFMSGGIARDCATWLDQVEAAIPSVVLQAKDAAGSDVVDVRVLMDDALLVQKLDGRSVEVEPGPHVFVFESPDAIAGQSFLVIEGRKAQVVLARFSSPLPPARQKSDPMESDRPSGGSTRTLHRVWLGISGSLDFLALPSADNICKLDPQRLQPLNAAGYQCVDPMTGANFPGSGPFGASASSAILSSASLIGGLTPANLRILLTFDYAIGMNVLLGARAGYVFFTDPAVAPGPSFPPLHLEARVTVLLGEDALASAFAPMFFAAGGVAEFDASYGVQLSVKGGTILNENAWLTAGPAFGSAGVGLRLLLGGTLATDLAIKGECALRDGASPLCGVAPELGLSLGL